MPRSTFLDGYHHNFEQLKLAARQGQLALVDCLDTTTGQQTAIVAAIFQGHEDDDFHIVPFAQMLTGNPYDYLAPPNPDGGYLLDS